MTRAFAQNAAAGGSSYAFTFSRKHADAQEVQCLLEENAKLETSTHLQSLSLFSWWEMQRLQEEEGTSGTPSPESESISIIRGRVYSDHERKGFWSRLMTCCKIWDRTGSHLPIQTGPMEVEPSNWKTNWGWELGLSQGGRWSSISFAP